MKYVFLLNSFTLGKEVEELKSNISQVCERLNLEYVFEVNSLERSTEDILNSYRDLECIIVAVGGDGIINRVLNGIVGTKNVLSFIPYGTGNDLYKSVSKQYQEPGKCDIVRINDKYFINVACFGIDADVANNSSIIRSKIIPKNLKYIIGLIYTFFKYKARNFKVYIDNQVVSDSFTTVAVCNGSYYGNGFMVGPRAKLNNGMVDVYLAPKVNKLEMIKLILSMKKGKHEDSDKITRYRTTSLVLKSEEEFCANIDGEELEAKEFEMEVIPEGIDLYYNHELASEVLKLAKKRKRL